MSKRTIIIFVLAIVAIIAGAASMYFDNKSTVDEANRIINGDESLEPKPEPKPRKAKVEATEVKENENGIFTEPKPE